VAGISAAIRAVSPDAFIFVMAASTPATPYRPRSYDTRRYCISPYKLFSRPLCSHGLPIPIRAPIETLANGPAGQLGNGYETRGLCRHFHVCVILTVSLMIRHSYPHHPRRSKVYLFTTIEGPLTLCCRQSDARGLFSVPIVTLPSLPLYTPTTIPKALHVLFTIPLPSMSPISLS